MCRARIVDPVLVVGVVCSYSWRHHWRCSGGPATIQGQGQIAYYSPMHWLPVSAFSEGPAPQICSKWTENWGAALFGTPCSRPWGWAGHHPGHASISRQMTSYHMEMIFIFIQSENIVLRHYLKLEPVLNGEVHCFSLSIFIHFPPKEWQNHVPTHAEEAIICQYLFFQRMPSALGVSPFKCQAFCRTHIRKKNQGRMARSKRKQLVRRQEVVIARDYSWQIPDG